MQTGKPQLVTDDMRDTVADTTWGVGLGCESEIRICIEPFQSGTHHHPLDLLALAAATGEDAALAHVFHAGGNVSVCSGFRLLHTRATPPVENGSAQHADWFIHLSRELQTCLTERRSRQTTDRTEQGRFDAFIEFLPLPLELTVLGAGNDAIPLIEMAGRLGWRVTVAAWRLDRTMPAPFPTARRVLKMPTVDEFPIKATDCVVVLTHHYLTDKAIVRRLLTIQLRYVGLLGPRRRTERMLRELAEEGVTIPEHVVADWHFPVGPDLGAETPAEIALSIVAEILAVVRHRRRAFLRGRPMPIHAPPLTSETTA